MRSRDIFPIDIYTSGLLLTTRASGENGFTFQTFSVVSSLHSLNVNSTCMQHTYFFKPFNVNQTEKKAQFVSVMAVISAPT